MSRHEGQCSEEGLIILTENLRGILCHVSGEAWLAELSPTNLEGSLVPQLWTQWEAQVCLSHQRYLSEMAGCL